MWSCFWAVLLYIIQVNNYVLTIITMIIITNNNRKNNNNDNNNNNCYENKAATIAPCVLMLNYLSSTLNDSMMLTE